MLIGGICLTQWQEYNWGTSFIRGIISFIGKYKEVDIDHVEEIVLGLYGDSCNSIDYWIWHFISKRI